MIETKVYHISFHAAHNLSCLFFWGCNFSCKGCLRRAEPLDCHFPGIKSPKPFFPTFITLDEIITALKKAKPKIVVFEGWEPTFDPNLSEITKRLHYELGSWNYLLTNGYSLPELEEMDEVKVSIKAISSKIHQEYTGKSNKRVLENFQKLYQSKIKLSTETVFIPDLIDKEEIGKIAKFIASVDKEIPLRIDAYWPIFSKRWRASTGEEIREAVEEAKSYLINVSFLAGSEEVKGEVIKLV
jgi:pyruvate-formate lyase-activating enzyme